MVNFGGLQVLEAVFSCWESEWVHRVQLMNPLLLGVFKNRPGCVRIKFPDKLDRKHFEGFIEEA